MPTLTTTEHGEIHVHHRQVTRMADRLWCLGSPVRRTAYVEKARQRLATGPARPSDAAIVLAAGAGLPPMLPDELVERWREVVPQLTDEVVDDTNHYSIIFGERGAKTIAERVNVPPSRRTR